MQHNDIIDLLLQLAIMLACGRLLAEFMLKLKQPAVVGELLAGVLLGPTILGHFDPEIFNGIFPSEGNAAVGLRGFIEVAVVLLLFIAGMEVDLNVMWQLGRSALRTSLLGMLIPFLLGAALPFAFSDYFPTEGTENWILALFLGTAMSITALPVIARILMDLDLFRSRLGILIIASAMMVDLVGWLIFSAILSLIRQDPEQQAVWVTILLTLGFTLFMLTAGKWLISRSLSWIKNYMAWPGGMLSLSIAFCFLSAAFTEYIGLHAIFGAFIFGVALGDSEYFPENAKEIVHQFINNVFSPLFFVSIGLTIDFIADFDFSLTLLIIVISFAGKIIGSGFGTWLGGYHWRESLAVGFGMNARGAMEIILGIIALEAGLITKPLLVALVIMALLTSITSGPLMKWSLGSRIARNPSTKSKVPPHDV